MTDEVRKELEFYIQGAQAARQMTPRSNRIARRFFKAAIDARGDFARAHGYLSYSLLLAHLHGWNQDDGAEDNDVTLEKVLEHANLAKTHGPNDYENHWCLAAAHIYSRNFPTGMGCYDDALELAATQAIPHNLSCLKVERCDALIFNGNKADIEGAVDIILGEMNQPDFPNTHLWALGWAYYELASFETEIGPARDLCQKSLKALLQIPNPHALIRKNIAASYAALEWTEAANVLTRDLRKQLPPTYRVVTHETKWPYGDTVRGDRWMQHLKSAGLPP